LEWKISHVKKNVSANETSAGKKKTLGTLGLPPGPLTQGEGNGVTTGKGEERYWVVRRKKRKEWAPGEFHLWQVSQGKKRAAMRSADDLHAQACHMTKMREERRRTRKAWLRKYLLERTKTMPETEFETL
jgi:hypothetical protein